MLLSLPFVPIGLFAKFESSEKKLALLSVALPSVVFLLLYSVLPHKEVRFIFPVLPALTATSAVGLDTLLRKLRDLRKVGKILTIFLLVSVLVLDLLASTSFSYISSLNYPGGYALRWLHAQNMNENNLPLYVHIDAYSAMNGISRFGYSNIKESKFVYSKKESDVNYKDYDFLIAHQLPIDLKHTFEIIHVVEGEPRFTMPEVAKLKEQKSIDVVRTEPAVFVLKKRT
jgi:alpha-1,6-mannosyltransferase